MGQRALFLAPIFPPRKGGAAVHFEQIAQGLLARDILEHAVVLTCFTSVEDMFELSENMWVLRILVPPEKVYTRFSYPKVALNSLLVLLVVAIFVGLRGTDVVHTQTKRYYEWGVDLARRLGASVLIDGRDLGAPDFGPTGDVFVAASRNLLAKADSRTEDVVYIPVGIEPSAFPDPDDEVRPADEAYILFVGDIVTRKGVDVLLKAYQDSKPNERLVFVGRGVEGELLASIARTDGAEHVGTRSHRETLQYIRNAQLVVLPSREEAFGRVALEAFYLETPVICPPGVTEFREQVPDLILPEVTPAALASQLASILEDEQVDSYPVERHLVENTIDRYVDVYEQHL